MTRYRLEVRVTPRPALLDPEGQAIHRALENLGHGEVEKVRMGKLIHLDVTAASPEDARRLGEDMARKLLANPVTEDSEVRVAGEVSEAESPGASAGDAPRETAGESP